MSLLDAVQTARGNSSVSPTSKPTTSGTSSLLGAVQVARGGVSPTPTSAPKPVGPVTIAKPQNESLLSKIGGYVTSTLNNLIAKVPSNTQDKVKMATNIASKLVTSQPQIKAAVTIAKNPVVAKYAKDSVDIGKDALKNGIETIKGAGQLTFPYQVYRAAIGKPVNASEYAKNVLSFGLDIIGLQWRATPLAPVVGAVSSQEKQLRQMAQNGKLKWDDLLKLSVGSLAGPIGRAAVGASIAGKDSLVEGINTQPGVGETFTDNVKLAQAIDTVFLGAMFAAPFVHAKISDLNVKASNFLDRIKPLDVSPNATMKEVTEAVRSKMKAHPDAFTLDPTEAGMKARTEITDALNAFKEAGFIDKKYAQAFDFFAKKLGIEIAPIATDIKETPKQLTDGSKPKETTAPKEKQAPEVVQNKIQEYRTQFPNEKILNADNVREVYKPEGYNRVNSNDYHPVSSETTKAIFNQDVATLKPGDNYLFTAGSSGAGKSSALRVSPDLGKNITAGLDSNFSSESSLQKLKQVIDTGANTGVLFTYREPTDAWENGIVKRAINPDNGRVVPLEVFLKNLENSPKYTLKAQELYGDKINLQVVDNSRGVGNAAIVDNPVEFLKNIRYNIEDVKQKAIIYVKNGVKNGSITPETGKALLGEYSAELSKESQPQRQEQQPSSVTSTPSSNKPDVTKGRLYDLPKLEEASRDLGQAMNDTAKVDAVYQKYIGGKATKFTAKLDAIRTEMVNTNNSLSEARYFESIKKPSVTQLSTPPSTGGEITGMANKYGTTTNPMETAFVDSNGNWINGGLRKTPMEKGHLKISQEMGGVESKNVNAITDVMDKTDSIRVVPTTNGLNIDVVKMPTDEQLASLEKLSQGKPITADITSLTSKGSVKSGTFNTFGEYKNWLNKNLGSGGKIGGVTTEVVDTTTSPHLLKNKDVTLEPQKNDGWCGPAALQYALKEQGFTVSQETLANGMGATVSQGADPGQITSEAKKQGLQTETIQGEDAQKTLATLDTALSEGKSVILDFLDGKDLQNDGHYVLYQGRENGNITVMDPQTGKPRNIDEQKFIDQWKDTTIKGNLFKRWATIIEKTPQVLGGKPEKRIIGRSKYATTGIREVLSSSESPEDSVNKLDTFVKDFIKGADQSNMADLRAGLVKEIDSLVGGTGNYKRDYAVRVAMRDDTEVGGLVRALEKHISDIDSTIKDYPEKNVSPAESVVGSETSITIPAEVNQAGQTPVGEGKLRESTAYKKIKSRISEELQLDVKYNPVNLTADIEKAVEFLDKNPKKAVQVALGLEKAPEGQLERNITIATAEKALADGDIELWNQIESSGSLRQTRKGQEIVADRGRFNDNSPHTYMRELISRRLDKLGYSFKQALKDAGRKVGSTKEAAIAKIDERTAKLREKLKKDQGKIKLAQDIIDLLRC